MALVLRYVNNGGEIVEIFLALVHVTDTTAKSLKKGIGFVFAKHGLSLSRLRGQGYDGASNMQGEYNGLKSLILNENPYAKYVHCFAHQLQLVVINVTKAHGAISDFFTIATMIINTCGSSCKIKDKLRQIEHEKLVEAIESGEIESGRELYPDDLKLKTYINDMVDKVEFFNIEDLGNLVKILVSTARDKAFPLVYHLIELTLILPVAIASVERVFSSMKIIKTDLRNRMRDE
ncbi:zinc finger MYM-type protein 1-like [Salvia splendens]|uniref:zinc finger MYM-type protein 1-like n=1 Tax=Salvia splendens TaxID=180675 RepID=UPI001C26B769|nr:zinc finger MYM-type protein 1-like [Salvia splendens]